VSPCILFEPLLINVGCRIDLLKLNKYNITVYLRNSQQALELEKLGLKTILGTLADVKTIEEATTANDVG